MPSENYLFVVGSKNKYKFATDIINVKSPGAKRFNHTNSIIELFEIFDKEPNMYEMLTSEYRKLYFDIDKCFYTREEFVDVIDFVIEKIEDNFDIKVHKDSVKISIGTETDNMIRSIHIIIDNMCFCHFLIQKAFATMLKEFIKAIDIKIYTRNRLFKYPGKCKPNRANSVIHNKYDCSLNEEIEKHFVNVTNKDGMVNLVGKCQKIKKPVFIKPISKVIRPEPLVQPMVWQSQPMVCATSLINLYNNIKRCLNTDFYMNSKDWTFATGIMHKKNMLDIEEWSELSSKQSNNNWSPRENLIYMRKLNKDMKSGLPLLLECVNKYTEEKLVYNPKLLITEQLCKYISDKSNISIDQVQNTFKNEIKNDNEIQVINFSDKVRYNKETGYLYNNEEVHNYINEIQLKEYHDKNVKLKADFTYDDMNDIIPEVIKFNKRQTDTMCIKAKWSSGKSYIVVTNMIKHHLLTHRIIIITENNALNSKFKNDYPTFRSHIEAQTAGSNIDFKNDNIIVSLESINKVIDCIKKPTLLIFDEYESIVNHFESTTIKFTYSTYKLWSSMIKQASKCVLLDADLSNCRIDIFQKIKKANSPLTIINVKQNKFSDYKFNMHLDYNSWTRQIFKTLKDGKKLCIAFTSRDKAIDTYNSVIKIENTKTALMVNRDGISLYKGGVKVHDNNNEIKTETLEHYEQFIIKNEVDVVIYTPTITTGVSFNSLYFDQCSAFGNRGSLCTREFLQMLFRARNLKDKVFNIFVKIKPGSIKEYPDIEEVKDYFVNNASTNENQSIMYHNIIDINDEDKRIFKTKTDSNYLTMRSANTHESYVSNKAFHQEFILKLVHNHGIPVTYIDKDGKDKDFINDIDMQAKTRKEKDLLRLVHCPLINGNEKIEIKEKIDQQNEGNVVSHEESLKYKLYCMIQRLNINDCVDVDNKEIADQNINERMPDDIKYILFEKWTLEYIGRFTLLNQIGYNRNVTISQALAPLVNGDSNETLGVKKILENRNHVIEVIYSKLPIDIMMTNKEFEEFINEKFIIIIKNVIIPFFEDLQIESGFKSLYECNNPLTKEQHKCLKNVLNHLLKHVNYKVQYNNKNTLRDYDKLSISQIKGKEFKLPIKDNILPQAPVNSSTDRNFSEVYLDDVYKNKKKNGSGFLAYGQKVFKNSFGNFRSYKVKKDKTLESFVKDINKKHVSNYKHVFSHCLTDAILLTYKPIMRYIGSKEEREKINPFLEEYD